MKPSEKLRLMNQYKGYLRCSEQCCLCGKEITEIPDLWDPFPLETNVELSCCQNCFHEKVIPARLQIIRKNHPRLPRKNGKTLEE